MPGVNEVLKAVGIAKNYPENGDPFYRDRGTAVHRAAELYIKDTLDESSVDPICAPYFLQAKGWIDVCISKNKIWNAKKETEVMVYSEKIGVAGTVDLLTNTHIYDWKCTKNVTDDTELKGAFYKVIFGIPNFTAIQLDGSDGPAIEIPYEASPKLVDAVMTLYRDWKRK